MKFKQLPTWYSTTKLSDKHSHLTTIVRTRWESEHGGCGIIVETGEVTIHTAFKHGASDWPDFTLKVAPGMEGFVVDTLMAVLRDVEDGQETAHKAVLAAVSEMDAESGLSVGFKVEEDAALDASGQYLVCGPAKISSTGYIAHLSIEDIRRYREKHKDSV